MKLHVFWATATALLFALTGTAAAEIVYSDTFSRTTGSGDGNGDPNGAADNFSDWGSNDNGLGGTVSQTWISGPSRAGGGRNAVTNGELGISHGTTSFFDFDAATVSPNGFTIGLDFSRFVTPPDPGPGAPGYIAFGLGVNSGTPLSDFTSIGASDFSILFQQANNGNAANAEAFVDNVSLGTFDYQNPDVPHSLFMTFTPVVSGQYGETDAINVNLVVDGTISQDYAIVGGENFGAFSVSANNFDPRYVDNLVVTAIPEPGSFAMIAAIATGSLFIRRRKA